MRRSGGVGARPVACPPDPNTALATCTPSRMSTHDPKDRDFTRCSRRSGDVGVPINYYLKPITAGQLAQMWVAKYLPGMDRVGFEDDYELIAFDEELARRSAKD